VSDLSQSAAFDIDDVDIANQRLARLVCVVIFRILAHDKRDLLPIW